MANRLASAVSPYLRSHADNPVDWFEWSAEAFAEAKRRDVPVLVSIGYATCHWCHVMARESFSDPHLADYLNEHFVAIKVDREEYPDVDASYLAAASVFTPNLGWPLNVFVTPEGTTFFAGTYFPPTPLPPHPAFRQILEAVTDAWTNRRAEVDTNAEQIATALRGLGGRDAGALPGELEFSRVVGELVAYEDREFGGFGAAPKFPVATVIGMLLDRGSLGDATAGALAERTLAAMAHSDLRDAVEGGFFRYSTMRDWSEPHYERMLYDNALLLGAYARAGQVDVASGIAAFLLRTMRQAGGAFASAQDSESVIDGVRVEGGYYALGADDRARIEAPPLDRKILTGWNGLAIEALASAGNRLGRVEWIEAARGCAEFLLAHHVSDDRLVRVSIGGVISAARATLEDYGMFASGLLELATATGEVRYATAARRLVDATLDPSTATFGVPGGADPVLSGHGLALAADPSEGAYPSGLSAIASAAHRLYSLTAHAPYLEAASATMEAFAPLAVQRPIAFGAALSVTSGLGAESTQLVVVAPGGARDDSRLAFAARAWQRSGAVVSVVSDEQARAFAAEGFELFDGRSSRGAATAYLCRDFVCALPVTDAASLIASLPGTREPGTPETGTPETGTPETGVPETGTVQPDAG
jgi:uncharacterized protein YyaL (SSP411 family)